MFVSNPLKALKPKPKLVPEQVPQKVFEETEPAKIPEPVTERRPPGAEKTPERVPEKVTTPERKVEETPKRVPEEKVPERFPSEEVRPDLVSKKQPERISVDKTPEKIPEAKPKPEAKAKPDAKPKPEAKLKPEPKPKPEVEESLPKGRLFFNSLKGTTSLVKIERRREAQKIQEVFYVTEKVSPTEEAWEHGEEAWEHGEVVEEHAEVSYEDEVARLSETMPSLSEKEFFLSSTEKATDQKSELRAGISVTDSSKKKEIRSTKHEKTQETVVVVQQTKSDRDKTTTKEIESEPEKIPSVTDAEKSEPVIIRGKETEGKVLIEVSKQESVNHVSDKPEDKYSRTETITIQQAEVTVKDKPTQVGSIQVKTVEEKTIRKEETVVKPAVIPDSKKNETSASEKVPVKKQEKKLKSDEIIKKPKPKEEATPKIKPEESVTDIQLQRPKGTKQESHFVAARTEAEIQKKEESKDVRQTEETSLLMEVQRKTSEPEKRRISPPAASRGTERNSNILIISIFNFVV
ncbi:neurofilament heavy polypeptide-like [Cebidichthys violaceus]|uniref:neurofilament heavy polypeptide-like n=1 Tax=Cebidichthys violaceus TaxID=271503 RepID=UPI0035CABCF9